MTHILADTKRAFILSYSDTHTHTHTQSARKCQRAKASAFSWATLLVVLPSCPYAKIIHVLVPPGEKFSFSCEDISPHTSTGNKQGLKVLSGPFAMGSSNWLRHSLWVRKTNQLTPWWQAGALDSRRRTLPRRKLTWTWSSSEAVDTRHVSSARSAPGVVNSWNKKEKATS